MQHVVGAGHGPFGNAWVGQIAEQEFDLGQVRQIFAFTRHQIVDNPDTFAAADKLFSEVGSNETGTAGDNILSHAEVHLSKKVAGSRWCGKTAQTQKSAQIGGKVRQ
jgi:hypothetical protein